MERARGRDCVWLLGALVTLFVLQPYLSVLSSLDVPLIRRIDSRMVGVIAYSAVLLVGLRAVSVQRKHLWKLKTGRGEQLWLWRPGLVRVKL